MEDLIDTLLEDIREWDEDTLGQFLCNIYALGCFDTEAERETEDTQVLLLLSPIMSSTVVFDYIQNRLSEYDEWEEIDF